MKNYNFILTTLEDNTEQKFKSITDIHKYLKQQEDFKSIEYFEINNLIKIQQKKFIHSRLKYFSERIQIKRII